MDGKYTIEIFDSEDMSTGAGVIFRSDDDLEAARVLYREAVARHHPRRIVMLCDRARIVARSDRSDTRSE